MPKEKFETILPEGFDGTFKFTNRSEEDFIGQWGGRGYLFPAGKMTPMVIYDATPLEVQNIRKKFARDYAIREFFKSKKYEEYRGQEGGMGHRTMNSIHQAAQYNDSDLEPYIQQCLQPLPQAAPTMMELPRENIEEFLARDEDEQIITQAVDKKTSLRKKALENQAVK